MSLQEHRLIKPIHPMMEVPIPDDMANAIRAKLLEKYRDSGMSQDRYAEESGVQQSTISNYFNEKKTITIETLARLAAVFNLDVESSASVRLVQRG